VRLDGIDILRGTAVTAVIVYHFFVLLGLTSSEFFPYVQTFGSLGVPLFFIISGYLIYRSIERNISSKGTPKGLLNYFFHRLFRILPAYYFNLLVVVLMAALYINNNYYYSDTFFEQFFLNFTLTSYFINKTAGLGINGTYWTLSIEMLWYIVAPFFLIYFQRTRILLFIMLLSILYIWGLAYGDLGIYLHLDSNYRSLLPYYLSQLPAQINYFIAGILIYKYRLVISLPKTRYHYLLVVVILSFFVGTMGYYKIHLSPIPSHLSILMVTTLLFVLLYTIKVKKAIFFLLEWIGKISYSLYLWHTPILFAMDRSHILEYRSLSESIVFFLLLLISISSMSYYFIEEGGFALREKLTKRFFHA